MSQVSFVKMSGTGNDFVIVDLRKNYHKFTSSQISRISQRNNVGCDQFILLQNSSEHHIFMDIYNSDGSQSDACGNATRCVADIIMQENGLNQIQVETNAGILKCKRINDSIAVNMGKPKFVWDQIPLSHKMNADKIHLDGLDFCAVNMGNPHIVTFLKSELSDEDFFKIGPMLESHKYFPQKTNVEFVTKVSDSNLSVRVWERGAGETMACGSGACAVGAIAIKHNIVNSDEIKITFKGGNIFISQNSNGEIIMRGGVTKIFYGIFEDAFLED